MALGVKSGEQCDGDGMGRDRMALGIKKPLLCPLALSFRIEHAVTLPYVPKSVLTSPSAHVKGTPLTYNFLSVPVRERRRWRRSAVRMRGKQCNMERIRDVHRARVTKLAQIGSYP